MNLYRQPAAALLIALLWGTAASAQDDTKAEIAKLRAEIAKLRDEIKDLKRTLGDGKSGPTYRGKSLDYWLAQLNDADAQFRHDAISALQLLAQDNPDLVKDRDLTRVMADALKKHARRDWQTANKAGQLLYEFGEESLPVLIEIALDKQRKSPEASTVAMTAIGRFERKAKSAIKPLVRIMREKRDHQSFLAAVEALGTIGPDAEVAVPELVKSLDEALVDVVKKKGFFNEFDGGSAIAAALLRITPDMKLPSAHFPIVESPKGVGGGGFGVPKGGFGVPPRIGKVDPPPDPRDVERQWRTAINALKKKFPAPK